ncbi:hypothetical protein PHYC_02577 [Phycisphaerales bacterium]|nr:hypothetical protein PHYC_02577 [Phycisphaerales bacterium]
MHSRTRKVLKWSAAAATLALLAIWVCTRWFYLWLITSAGITIHINSGLIAFGSVGSNPGVTAGLTLQRHSRPRALRLWFESTPPGSLPYFALPLWLPAVAFAALTVIAWRGGRPPSEGFCAACAYDRRGLDPAAACPECGSSGGSPDHQISTRLEGTHNGLRS